MATRISVYDRQGVPIGELPGIPVIYSDEINRAGKAIFTVGITDPTLTAINWKIRNLVLIEDTYLGNWVGVISGNTQEWALDHVEFTAWEASYLMSFRRSPEVELYGTGGTIFGKLIDMANSAESLTLVKDVLWAGGAQTTLSLKYDNLYNALLSFANRVQGEFKFIPSISNGRLGVLAQWHQRIGRNDDFTLTYPADFRAPGGSIMSVGSEPVNNWLVFGAGATQDSTPVSNPPAGTEDAESRSTYGLIQGVETNNMVVQASLDDEAATMLLNNKNPRRTFRIDGVQNTTKQTFQHLALGNVINISLAGVGFNDVGGLGTETTVRIVAREYNPQKGVLNLTVDEFLN